MKKNQTRKDPVRTVANPPPLPRNLTATGDLTVHLAVILAVVAVLAHYDGYLAAMGLTLWIALASFARERCRDRERRFSRYVNSVALAIGQMNRAAAENLPQAILIVNEDCRLEWTNGRVMDVFGKEPPDNVDIREVWAELIPKADSIHVKLDGATQGRGVAAAETGTPRGIWHNEGEYVFADGARFFKVHSVPFVPPTSVYSGRLAILYVQDISDFEHLKLEYRLSRVALLYVQIDNYDEVTLGQSETERTTLLLEVGKRLDAWVSGLSGFMRRIKSDTYLVLLTRASLETAMKDKFDILDKVRELTNSKNMPVTLSMGVAVADGRTMADLGQEAQRQLDLALGRGGDQTAVAFPGNDKPMFFGGRTQAAEKHTRVKSRVVAHAIRELMEGSDAVYVMGHANEDFDSFGAAIGVARLGLSLSLQTHIVLSDMNDGIEKLTDLLTDKNGDGGKFLAGSVREGTDYKDLIIHADEFALGNSIDPLLVVVDTHIPHLTAAPKLLERIKRVIVIDHHRRADKAIQSPQLVYIEPSASSTSELITEIVTYSGDNVILSGLEATALYAGIVVDTKNFAVGTGVRTFDAAAFLRRSGADPVIVRHLFRSDFETTMALAKIQVNSQYYAGGLIVGSYTEVIPNIQAIAAQAADSFLRVENTRMSIVCFKLDDNTVGISARSTGELNVQVIMEGFGGGGHANVAGAQVKGSTVEDVKKQVIQAARDYIAETDKSEEK